MPKGTRTATDLRALADEWEQDAWNLDIGKDGFDGVVNLTTRGVLFDCADELRTELDKQAGGAPSAEEWKRRAEDAERMASLIVRAAGGEVRVPSSLLTRDRVEIFRMDDPSDLSVVFTVR